MFQPTLAVFFVLLAFVLILKTVKIVPQQQVWIAERLGKYYKNLEAGFNIIIPFIDRVSYKHSLKETAMDIHAQSAITKDNVTLTLDGILYTKILDAKQASYGVENPAYAITQLAQTTMRSEIGKLTMDTTFSERESLNIKIVESINEAAIAWGVQCMRYEIKDITPPASVLKAMEKQVTAEREKRAEILDSEAYRQAQINKAEGEKRQVVLTSEGAMTDQINRAKGEAEAILVVAQANADGIEFVAKALGKENADGAMSLKVAEKYIEAFAKLAKENNTILLPANTGDVSSMVAQAMSVIKELKNKT